MANNVILGSDLMLFKYDATTSKYKPLACATSCKLSISTGTLETSSKDSGSWVNKQASKLSWTASSDNLFTIDDFDALADLQMSRSTVRLGFSIASGTSPNWEMTTSDGKQWFGDAIITSLEMNASDGDNATYSVQFEGIGALTQTSTTA